MRWHITEDEENCAQSDSVCTVAEEVQSEKFTQFIYSKSASSNTNSYFKGKCKRAEKGFRVLRLTDIWISSLLWHPQFNNLLHSKIHVCFCQWRAKPDCSLSLNKSRNGFYFKVSKLYFQCACSGTRDAVYPLHFSDTAVFSGCAAQSLNLRTNRKCCLLCIHIDSISPKVEKGEAVKQILQNDWANE